MISVFILILNKSIFSSQNYSFNYFFNKVKFNISLIEKFICFWIWSLEIIEIYKKKLLNRIVFLISIIKRNNKLDWIIFTTLLFDKTIILQKKL